MALPGTRFGAYEILTPIGAGGPPSFAFASRANYGEVSPKPKLLRTR